MAKKTKKAAEVAEIKNPLNESDYILITKYRKQIETAAKYRFAAAIPAKDMRALLELCHRLDNSQPIRVFCATCKAKCLSNLYKYL